MEKITVDHSHIKAVLDRTPCHIHQVSVGTPCWHLALSSGQYAPAVCNRRAKQAGFNGRINPNSLRRKSRE